MKREVLTTEDDEPYSEAVILKTVKEQNVTKSSRTWNEASKVNKTNRIIDTKEMEEKPLND